MPLSLLMSHIDESNPLANSRIFTGEARKMQKNRFVIVPVAPLEKESFQVRSRHFAVTVSGAFDIYDNQ